MQDKHNSKCAGVADGSPGAEIAWGKSNVSGQPVPYLASILRVEYKLDSRMGPPKCSIL